MPPYQGTMGVIRTAVIDRLKLDVTQDTGRVLEWINLSYAQAVQETGCFQTCGVMALTPGAVGYNLPTDCQWVKSIHYTYPDGTISVPFDLVSLDEILRLRQNTQIQGERVSQPCYSILGQNRLELWPDSSPGQTVKFWYVYLPPALVQPTDPVLITEPYGSKLLELGACIEGAKFKKDPLMQSYQSEYQDWMRRFQGWLNKRRTGTGVTMQVVTGRERTSLSLVSDTG